MRTSPGHREHGDAGDETASASSSTSILLYETWVWRFALPRAGGQRRAQRSPLPTRPLSHSQSKQDEAHKRQAWTQYRTWSRLISTPSKASIRNNQSTRSIGDTFHLEYCGVCL